MPFLRRASRGRGTDARSCQRTREDYKMTVASMQPGQTFRVKRIVLSREVGKRLADMGFTEGASGTVVRKSLFGGRMQVRIRHYDVVLRRSEAAGVEAEPSSGGAPSA